MIKKYVPKNLQNANYRKNHSIFIPAHARLSSQRIHATPEIVHQVLSETSYPIENLFFVKGNRNLKIS